MAKLSKDEWISLFNKFINESDKDSFGEDKAFMLRVIEGARQKLGWETLGYEPNEEFVAEYLDTFQKLIERMTAEDIIEESLTEWLSEADENDPTRCGSQNVKYTMPISVFMGARCV